MNEAVLFSLFLQDSKGGISAAAGGVSRLTVTLILVLAVVGAWAVLRLKKRK